MTIRLAGGGGKSGGGSTRVAQEDANTLRSNSIVKTLHLVSSGPCYGLSDAQIEKSVFIDSTAVMSSAGTYNFSGLSIVQRTGEAEQDYIPGFVSAANVYSVGVEVKKDTPLVRTLPGPIDAARVTVGIPYLARQDTSNGDLLRTTLDYKLSKRQYGAITWEDVHVVHYNDKCVSTFNETLYIPLGGSSDWDIKFERLTDDSTSSALSNKTEWTSTTVLSENKFSYPSSAIVGLSLDAKQFGSSVSTVCFKFKGVLCKVPTNYDPAARTYAGIWDGTFKIAWTNNPAWLLLYVLTDIENGLGQEITMDRVDIYGLYSIAVYCDDLVPNGYGGYEPRYSFNYQFMTSMDAYALVQILCGAFRGIAYWGNGTVMFRADMPKDMVRVYTESNVIDGFQYEGIGLSARHSRVAVTWFDPDNFCKPAIEIVDDPDAFELYGLNEVAITAYGRTTRGAARRDGLWVLDAEKATQTVNFGVGPDSGYIEPGDIVGVADALYAGVEIAAMVLSGTTTSLTLDREITLNSGERYTAYVNMPDGTVAAREISNAPGVSDTITLSSALPFAPMVKARVGFSSDLVAIRQYMVLAITEQDSCQYRVTAISHDPDKYGRVELGLKLDPPSYSSFNRDRPASPVSGSFVEYLYRYNTVLKSAVTVTWTPGANAVPPRGYEIQMQRADTQWVSSGEIPYTTYDFKDVDDGVHSFRVRAISVTGMAGDWYLFDGTLFGEKLRPDAVEQFSMNVTGDTALLTWASNSEKDFDHYVVKFSSLTSGAVWESSNLFLDNLKSTSSQVPTRVGSYLIKSVNIAGVESAEATIVVNTVPGTTGMNAVASVSDYPTWTGVSEGVVVDGTTIKLMAGRNSGVYYLSMSGSLGTIYSSAIDVLSSEDILALGDVYGSIGAIDLGAAYRCQLSALLDVYGQAVGVHWEDLGLWKDLGTWSSGDPNVWNVRVEVQTTSDDPSSPSAVWSNWHTLVVGYYNARGFRFRLILNTDNTLVVPVVADATITIDMPDRIITEKSITSSTSGTTVSFDPAFREVSAVGITGKNMATGDYFQYTSAPATSGFTIVFKNSSGVAISRDFDYIATGYGEET